MGNLDDWPIFVCAVALLAVVGAATTGLLAFVLVRHATSRDGWQDDER